MNEVKPRRRGVRTVAWVAALALAGGAAWWAWSTWGGGTKTDLYLYATVERGDIEDLVTATGTLQPLAYVDVGAQISGQLKKIHVEVGTEVEEGELLAEIDAEQSQARVDASRANLRAQDAQLQQLNVNLLKAERDLQRQKNLMAEEASTTEQLQNADTTLKVTRAQINTLKAQIEQLRASTRVEESNLRFTKIYAPMTGTVVSITARQGQTLNTNQSAPIVLRVADLSTMTVQTQVSEADVTRLRIGMPAYFTTLGNQTRRWNGRLKKIEPTPTVTNNVVLYNALFDVPNPNRVLMTNMTAQVFFITAQARDALLVPMSALALQQQQRRERGARSGAGGAGAAAGASAATGAAPTTTAPTNAPIPAGPIASGAPRADAPEPPRPARGPRAGTVKVVAPDGSLSDREVQVGVSNRVQAEILSGLGEGERVVAGLRQSDAQRRAAQQGQRGGGGLGGPPPFGGPGR